MMNLTLLPTSFVFATFPVAMIKAFYKATSGRVYFGSQFEDTAHHGMEVKRAGA